LKTAFFPRIIPGLSDEERENYPPIQKFMDIWGCPTNLLYLGESEYLRPIAFRIHKIQELQLKKTDGTIYKVKVDDQLDMVPKVIADICEPKHRTIIVNAYPDLADGTRFIWHLLANVAAVKANNPIKNRNLGVTYVGNIRLEDALYQPSKMVFLGPILDEFGPERTINTVESLFRFQAQSRLIFTSSGNLPALLEKLRLSVNDVHYFFNISGRAGIKKRKSKTTPEVI